jgi:hypothetical protein
VLENAEFAAQPEIHGAASELFRRQRRLDANLALLQVTPDVNIRENHLKILAASVLYGKLDYGNEDWHQWFWPHRP